MICKSCKSETSRIKILSGGLEICPHCSNMKESGGAKIDGLITRNSLRVRSESIKHEEDFITPDKYDKSKKRLDINDDFIKKYPDQARNNYSPEQLKKAGYNKLADKVKKETKQIEKIKSDVEFHGDTTKAVRKAINAKD